jgi:hypothetical protein
MLSSKRVSRFQGAYKLPDGTVELVTYNSYESLHALFDVIVRANGETILQKNCRVNQFC